MRHLTQHIRPVINGMRQASNYRELFRPFQDWLIRRGSVLGLLNPIKFQVLPLRWTYLGVLVAQWLGRRTSDPAVSGSIPRPRVIRHLSQLSLPSLRGR